MPSLTKAPTPALRTALDGLSRIANDSKEDPARRERARTALDIYFGTDQSLLLEVGTSQYCRAGIVHRTSGGAALAADAEYDGWTTR